MTEPICTLSVVAVGCCIKEIPVPWNESLAVVALGLWSILSTAAVVNIWYSSKLMDRQLAPHESVGRHYFPFLLRGVAHSHRKYLGQD